MSTPSERLPAPALSVVLPAPERIAKVLRAVRAIAAQRIAGRIELLIVARDATETVAAETAAGLGSVRVVPMPDWTTMTAARVRGILETRAPIVALAEDHCFPAPDWAEALLAAHQEPWAAVGPAFVNANPGSLISWANLAIEYGPWLHPVQPGATTHVPGHNSSYKREVLVSYGERLEAMLEAESVMHWDLARRGLQVAMAPDARTRHENFSLLGPSLRLRYCSGRLFAASRAEGWPSWRRAVFAAGAPVIPALRAWRTWRHLRRVPRAPAGVSLMPLIVFLLLVDAVGEGVGYGLGAGEEARRLSAMEHDRPRFMRRRDRPVL
jgi:glycosyltransferase involved in cell wall biosynthesis